ncbi:PVC-type heme-binding CxxCH protein [Gimesia aquarii]|uniref:Trehalose utilization n=1 Tax=Gimesia aquarii TaxID=2527964 RepID=A0A517WQ63_9PLAN|nr:PVC-type heme-binding CxxCH protein [Gimesia aquarii]QDU07378.1 Trehalose utilization [Gimesia aquarii]
MSKRFILIHFFLAVLVSFVLFLNAHQSFAADKKDQRPHVVFVVGTTHYSPQKTIPVFAKQLEKYGFKTTVIVPQGNPERNKNQLGLPGLEVLEQADLAVFYMRFLQLPPQQFAHIQKFVKSGKPVIGLRTSTHAFAYPQDHPLFEWNHGFGKRALGSAYFLHLSGETVVEHVLPSRNHEILNGVAAKFIDPGTLYKTELPEQATPLLMGTGKSKRTGKIKNRFGTHELKSEMSWPVAWTWKNEWGGRVFATTIGHEKSFQLDTVNRLLINGIHWCLEKPVGTTPERMAVANSAPNLKRPFEITQDHSPEKERKTFSMLPGYEVNLFAAEPMLVNPIHMTWDPQGRLWVICSTSYPQVSPGEKPNDQIVVLEDTDQDGRADKSTVFADGLYVPTGLELGDGGVYVANAPDLLFLKDTDGDGKADHREVVLTGFATEDNHHSISAWRWGPGGWLYFQEGTFMHSQVETPYGTVRLENGGVFQFHPRTLKLNVFADYRASNPWGHMFDDWGQSFIIDNPRLYFSAPLTANSHAKLGFDASGSGTKQCGGEFVASRHFPDEVQGEIWTNQYKAHVVARYEVSDDGAGFSIKGLDPLIQSSSSYFRPVDLKMGPDGAAYILDWYNPLIGHMQHSFRDERRDTTHGRVWRVTYKDRPLVKHPQLIGVPLSEVVSHLKDPESYTRHQVKRVLYDADQRQAKQALDQWVANLNPQESKFAHHQLEALWCYQTIGVINETLLREVLKSKDARARAAGLRVLRYWHPHVINPLKLLETAIHDPHPRVRLEAILTAGYIPDAQSVAIAVKAIDAPMDRYLEHGLKLTIDGLQPHWFKAHQQGQVRFEKPEHKNYALANLLSNESIDVIIDLLNAGSIDAELLKGPAKVVAEKANANQLEPLVLTLVEVTREYKTQGGKGISPEALSILLDAMDRAARERGVIPKGNIGSMLSRSAVVPGLSVQKSVVRLIGSWKLTREGKRLQRYINSPDTNPEVKQLAAESLGMLGNAASMKYLKALANSKKAINQRLLGVYGLAAHDLKQAAKLTPGILDQDPAGQDPAWFLIAFTKRKGGSDILAEHLNSTQIHPQVAAKIRQHLIETGETNQALITDFGGAVMQDSLEAQLLKENVLELAAEVREQGNAQRGEQIFRRMELACMKCHSISNAGPVLGPDLAAIGSSSPPDYIVDSFLRPSKVIKEFYESIMVVTDEGRVINGILVVKDDNKVVLKDAAQQGKQVTIPAEQIEFTKKLPSLMPLGLANKLKDRQEFLDLVKFVTELGRPGPYATSVAQVVRRWRLRGADNPLTSDDLKEFPSLENSAVAAYSMVNGTLPASDLNLKKPLTQAIALVDVTQAGNVKMKINSVKGLKVWQNQTLIPVKESTQLLLPSGRNQITFEIDRATRGEMDLRVEFLNSEAQPNGRFKVVGGP